MGEEDLLRRRHAVSPIPSGGGGPADPTSAASTPSTKSILQCLHIACNLLFIVSDLYRLRRY
jgi:hypothetical protein